MDIEHLIIVLGKRLNRNQLTDEGVSRVDALVDYLKVESNRQTAVAFCGGVTKGQSISEADAMHKYYLRLESQLSPSFTLGAMLLEQLSTNTVENIQNLASQMIETGLFVCGQSVKVTFISNDYHLQRIFEIQALMDEQGLLKVLIEKCSELGVNLKINRQLAAHVAVPYPHQNIQGQLFLLMDALTTYRVYLEGVSAGVFKRDLQRVRQQPERLSLDALAVAKLLVEKEIANRAAVETESVATAFVKQSGFQEGSVGPSSYLDIVGSLLPLLTHCIQQTPADTGIHKVREYLALLDTNLTLLNRYLDPESDHTPRWWR
ncbi:YdcF family protein [uncultured Vibrio sp.]|uniref:YdcF family protein n=1 Tax=uncultured Vibrio sp. TaxID=114054 RepID=UPI002630CF30|nr:YdcF family protein [uncultured Vibrio sp.]